MEARPERNYGRNLIIRLGLLVAIALLGYATPGPVRGQQGCGMDITETPSGDIVCANCYHADGDCNSGYCCHEDPTGDAWGIDENGDVQRYTCFFHWDTCEEN